VQLKNLLLLFILAYVPPAFPCDDPQLRSAVIGGHIIDASVVRARKPLKRVKIRLFSEQKLFWTGITDKDGRFTIADVPSGKYKLSVEKWGSVEIELKAELDVSGTGQRPYYSLMLIDNTCVATVMVEN
jgi:hypothetical protein